VTADFPEVDAVNVADGQGAVVTLQALSNVSVNARVTSVSPVSTVVSNVVEYPVEVVLDNTPSGLKPGETANVEVVVSEADNALYLASSAVTTRGGTSTVTALVNGKQQTVTVTTGVVGTSTTQITSGLHEGEKVVLASTSSSTSSSGFPGVGGFGGGGIGGLGGSGLLRGGGGR
jgi:multidrug efflux pump subunit AcrA (membrane-fusion protein)